VDAKIVVRGLRQMLLSPVKFQNRNPKYILSRNMQFVSRLLGIHKVSLNEAVLLRLGRAAL